MDHMQIARRSVQREFFLSGPVALIFPQNKNSCNNPQHQTERTILHSFSQHPHNRIATDTMSPNSTFRFLDLPPELRTRIYSELLVMDGDLFIYHDEGLKVQYRNRPSHHGDKPLVTVGLLRTCKQIYFEATPVLYGNNTIGASQPNNVKFLQAIGPSIQHIRSFFVAYCNRPYFEEVCQLLESAPFLERLSLADKSRAVLECGRERFPFVLAPLMRSLDQAWKKHPDKKGKDVLEILNVDPGLLGSEEYEREHTIAQAKAWEEEIKSGLKEELGRAAKSSTDVEKQEVQGQKDVGI